MFLGSVAVRQDDFSSSSSSSWCVRRLRDRHRNLSARHLAGRLSMSTTVNGIDVAGYKPS
jgi:hypothetical protein